MANPVRSDLRLMPLELKEVISRAHLILEDLEADINNLEKGLCGTALVESPRIEITSTRFKVRGVATIRILQSR